MIRSLSLAPVLLLSCMGTESVSGMLHTATPPAHLQSRFSKLDQKINLAFYTVWVLSCEKEVQCDTSIVTRELSQLLKQIPSLERDYKIAKILASLVKLPTTELTASEKSNPDILLQETEDIIDALEAHLATRGISMQHRILRAVYNQLSPYTHLILMASVPCAVYGVYRATDVVSQALEQRIPDAHKQASLTKTWSFFEKVFIALFVGEVRRYIDTASAQETLIRSKDYLKGIIASALALPFKNSNPASSSKISLNDTPLQNSMKQQLRTVARFIAEQEAIIKMGGRYPKGILITGDMNLATQAAQGLASEITQSLKASGVKTSCTVATVSISRLLEKESFKKQIERIKQYNACCVIVIQDLEWLAQVSDEIRTTVIADLLNTIKSTLKPYESYIIIGATRDRSVVDSLLLQPGQLELSFDVTLQTDRELAEACVTRVTQLYGLTLANPDLYERVVTYTMRTSFDALKSLFSRTYTQALPQIGLESHNFNEAALERELSLIECS